MPPSVLQSSHMVGKSQARHPPTFPLPEKPSFCWANEHMAPAYIERHSWTFLGESGNNVERPYYVCTTCENGTINVFRNSFYPRGSFTWDDDIGIHLSNPRYYYGFPSRQDRKCTRAFMKSFGDGFWICASGACDYFSDRKDGLSYEEARKLHSLDWFYPHLLEGILPYC